MDNGEQIFKTNTYQWFLMFLAYSKVELEQAPSRFLDFQKYMKEANSAIRAANIEGVGIISENPADIDIINLSKRQTNLKKFACNIYREADELIDDPFFISMSELSGAIKEHSRFQVDYNGEVQTIEYGEQGSEYIDKLFQALIDSNDYDSKELTGNENVDKYIKEYSKFDQTRGQYGYETALHNWNHLNADQKEALRHMYEYNYRLMEKDIYGTSYEAKAAQDTLNRMNECFYEIDDWGRVTVNDTARGLLKLNSSNKEKTHSYKLLSDFASGEGKIDAGFYRKDLDGNVTENHYFSDTTNIRSKSSLKYEYDKAGIRLVFRNELQGIEAPGLNREIEIGYYITRSRCEKYIASEENKTPGCYDHVKELGFGKSTLVSMLLSAENSNDMHIFDNITKGKGDYSKVFDRDVEKLSDSGKQVVSDYILLLQSAYASTGETRYEDELVATNEFFTTMDNRYSQGYYHLYVDTMRPYISQEDLVDIWISPYYKLTEEEIKEAKTIIKENKKPEDYALEAVENVSSTILGPTAKFLIPNNNKYSILRDKCSGIRSAQNGFDETLANFGDFVLDTVESIEGTKLELEAKGIDWLFGTNTAQTVRDVREKYSEWSENWKNPIDLRAQNASTQHPICYAGGKVAGNILLYYATAPVFGEWAAAMGIENAAGRFVINQIGQNVQDLVLDTRVEYEKLTADGDFSVEDQKKIRNNVIFNMALNGLMGVPELAHDLKIEKAAKETEKAIGNAADVTHHSYKGVDSSAANNIKLEKLGDVDGAFAKSIETPKVPDGSVAKNADVAKAGKSADAAKAGNVDEVSKITKQTGKTSPDAAKVPDGSVAKNADAAKAGKSADAVKAGNVDEVSKITKQTGKTAPDAAKVPDESVAKNADVAKVGKSADAAKAGNVDEVSKITKQTGKTAPDAAKVPDGSVAKNADAAKAGNVDGVSKITKQTEAPKVLDDAAIKSDNAASAPGDATIKKNVVADMDPEANIAKIEAEALEQKEAEHLAEQILKKAKAAEAETTATMKSLEVDGGHLEGLEYRLKSQESLSRKIVTDSHAKKISLDEAASNINDSLRYTLAFDEANYTKDVDSSLNKLREQGYVVEELKNRWGNPAYQGINVTLSSPEGVKLELQFHTDASYYTKDLNHSYYEIARSEFASRADKIKANEMMIKNQSKVNAPTGVMSIGRQMEITPEAKLAKTEAVQQASKIGKKIEGKNVAANVAIEANKEATEAIEKVGKKLGYSDNVVKSYSKKIEDIEFEYYENELKKATKKTSVSKQEVIDYRRTQISDADYYKMVAQKKLNGMDDILQYKNRFDAGAFEKGYSLDEILEYKINKNAPVKDYSGIKHGDFLPTVDAFIADDQIISHMKEALPNNASIQGCTTLQELADVLANEKPTIELVVFQSKAPEARNIEYFNGSFGNGSLGFREGGVYSVPKYKLDEYAANYSNLCGFNNGKFEIYDYKTFGEEVLSGVKLDNDFGVYMIETIVPINGKSIGMPSVNNCCAYMDEFVSGGYLRVKPEIELTQKQLTVDLKNRFGVDDDVIYEIHVLDGNTSKVSQNSITNVSDDIYDNIFSQQYDPTPDYSKFLTDPTVSVKQVRTKNMEVSVKGKELSGEAKLANEKFRGDKYTIDNSFDGQVYDELRKQYIEANLSTTCKINENLNGYVKDNSKYLSKMTAEQKIAIECLKNERRSVDAITKDTVMQKVIPEDKVKEYLKSEKPLKKVGGCVSKAQDIAPFANNMREAYENLRLDYIGNPFSDVIAKNGDMYVIRFKSDYCPTNDEFAKIDPSQPWNQPPCTSTGFLGSKERLIPEYSYGTGQKITDGAIYKIDSNGKETMIAYWKNKKFNAID